MKRVAFALAVLLAMLVGARAESALDRADLKALEEFSEEYAAEIDVRELAEDAAAGRLDALYDIAETLRGRVCSAAGAAAQTCAGLFAPALMLALLHGTGAPNRSGTRGAGFCIRLALLLGMLECGAAAIETARVCIRIAANFTDAVAPVLSAFLTTLGRIDAAALVSPAEALVGNVCVDLFEKYGLPLCRCALCTAAAGGLSQNVRLDRLTGMLTKTVCWGTGLCVTAFTALTAVRSGLSASIDSVAVRTAKYAVDSAAPVIGSGVSDAWDAVVSGVCIAKNAVGVSGMIALGAACVLPVLKILAILWLQDACAALLEALGDRETAAVVAGADAVCKGALTMCTGSIAISIIFLGAAMHAGAG